MKITAIFRKPITLGILNYARDYIPNLSRKAGPLFAKLKKTGQQHFNFQDTKL